MPVDEHRFFGAGSIASIVTRLRTFGVAQLTRRVVLLLLLAWAPLPNAVVGDTPGGGTPLQEAIVGVAGGCTR